MGIYMGTRRDRHTLGHLESHRRTHVGTHTLRHLKSNIGIYVGTHFGTHRYIWGHTGDTCEHTYGRYVMGLSVTHMGTHIVTHRGGHTLGHSERQTERHA